MPNIGYLNGRFSPLEQVTVSAEDRGFQFGDGVYEVIRTYDGVLFEVDEHLARLERSLREIRIPLPMSRAEWTQVITEGIARTGYTHCKVYLQVTRGTAPRTHQFPVTFEPTVLMTVREMIPFDPEERRVGVAAITAPDVRWGRCDIKSLNLLPNVLAKQHALDAGAFEAIFLRHGLVTEGTASNVMVVRNGTVHTPELDERILAGVTLKLVMDIAGRLGYSLTERAIPESDLRGADEIFLVGTTIDTLPVVRLDGQVVSRGTPGPVWRAIHEAFVASIPHS